MPSTRLPTVFVFDVDETMIGVSNPIGTAIELREFVMHSQKIGKLPKVPKVLPRSVRYAELMPPHMLRPNFKESLVKIVKLYPTAEFFVYSAGTEDYVASVVAWIEQQISDTGITFRRPLLSRNNTMTTATSRYIKSVSYHIDNILTSLEADYPALKNEKNRQAVEEHRIIHIDDRENILWEGSDKLVRCPAYSYTPVVNMITGLEPFLNDAEVKTFIKSMGGFVEPEPMSMTEDERNMSYHLFMAEQYRLVLQSNKTHLADTFCHDFVSALKLLKNLKRPFTKENVMKINKAITKRV